MEIRENETNFIFEHKIEDEVFTLTMPKLCTWMKAHQASHAIYEEIVRLSYKAALDLQAAKALEDANKPAEEVAAEVVS